MTSDHTSALSALLWGLALVVWATAALRALDAVPALPKIAEDADKLVDFCKEKGYESVVVSIVSERIITKLANSV